MSLVCSVVLEDTQEARYTHWSDDAPGQQATTQRHTCVTVKSPIWRWDTSGCSEQLPFICEFSIHSLIYKQ